MQMLGVKKIILHSSLYKQIDALVYIIKKVLKAQGVKILFMYNNCMIFSTTSIRVEKMLKNHDEKNLKAFKINKIKLDDKN